MIETDDYRVYIEWSGGTAFGHCNVYRWSHNIARNLISDMIKLHRQHGEPRLLVIVPIDDKHLHKFLSKIGFSYYMTKWLPNDTVQDIWIAEEINANSFRCSYGKGRGIPDYTG